MATSKGGYVSGGFDILKAPNAPTITSVATNIGSATVAFTAPTDVGGGAITSYTITAVDESTGASTGAVGAASPITISPGSGTFKIRAAATNIYGPGRVTAYDTGNQIYAGAELEAWGRNNIGGALGDGTTVNKSSPVQIGALTNWAQVSAGFFHTACVTTAGTLFTWGSNGNGQLGQNNVINRSSPVQVGALTNWAQVSAGSGSNHTACVTTAGTLFTWGRNNLGQLGDGTTVDKSSPVQVGALTNWARVAAGRYHTACVKTDGTLWTWGNNYYGQLGDGTRANKSSPIQVGALTNWAQVSGFNQTACVKTDGTLFTWGRNNNGQLGDGTVAGRSSPVQVGSLTNWAQVSAGGLHTVCVKTDGTLWAWGQNTANGQLGDGTTVDKSSPIQVGALTNWAQSSAGNAFSTCVKTDGTLWTWGGNNYGQLGNGTVANQSSPVQVGALTSWYQVSAGGYHTTALYGVV